MNKEDHFKLWKVYKGNSKMDWNREKIISNTSRVDDWERP